MYREKIYEVIERTGQKIEGIVIPKNTGLKGYAWKVLKEAGLDLDLACETGKDSARAGGLEILFQRGEDIPRIVMDEAKLGRVVLGITGDDLYDEFRLREPANTLKVENTYDWKDPDAKYLRPALCLIGVQGKGFPSKNVKVAVTARYEWTAKEYLSKSPVLRGKEVVASLYNGGLERAVASGANDIGIDVVYTGKSLQQSGLEILDEVRFSDLVVISPLKKRDESPLGRAIGNEFEYFRRVLENPGAADSNAAKLLESDEQAIRYFEMVAQSAARGFRKEGADMEAYLSDLMWTSIFLAVRKGCSSDDLAKAMLVFQQSRGRQGI